MTTCVKTMAQILIIEDESSVLQLIKEIVQNAGHSALCATNGKEGLDAYRQHDIDLVITDIVMPQKDGVEAIREIRNHDPEASVIAITGYRGQFNRLPAAEYVGAQKTLVKPFSQKELIAAVDDILQTT